MSPTRPTARRAFALAATLLVLAGLSACAQPSSEAPYTITDTWVKSVDSGMTAAFGVLTNNTSSTVTVVSAETSSASKVELHEVVMGDDGAMVMQPKPGGFEIAPHESLTLQPGGFHIMLMGVTEPIVAGDTVTITLTFSDDSTLTFDAIAKDFAGGNETYTGGGTMGAATSPTPDAAS